MQRRFLNLRWMSLLTGVVVGMPCLSAHAAEKTCFYVNSYNKDNGWAAGIAEALAKRLQGICRLETFEMDTRRHNTRMYSQQQGAVAAKMIEEKHPDVVIVSDDNATADVLVAHFKNAKTPFVFCGVNWTIAEYKLPFSNTTGMIEVVPIEPLISEVRKAIPNLKQVSFLAADTESERKEFVAVKAAFEAQGIDVKSYWATTFESWKRAFEFAQDNDLVYFSAEAGIPDWDKKAAIEFVKTHTKKLSVGPQKWLIDYVGLTVAKVAAEQGEFAADAAIKILNQTPPSKIPIVRNKQVVYAVNAELLKRSGIVFPESFFSKVKVK